MGRLSIKREPERYWTLIDRLEGQAAEAIASALRACMRLSRDSAADRDALMRARIKRAVKAMRSRLAGRPGAAAVLRCYERAIEAVEMEDRR